MLELVFELVIEPDLSNVFLYLEKCSQLFFGKYGLLSQTNSRNSICEDTVLVSVTPAYNQPASYIHIRFYIFTLNREVKFENPNV